MRRIVDIIFLGGAIATLAGILSYRTHAERAEQTIEAVAEDLRRMELMIKYRAATGDVELNGRGWPTTIDPAWFGEDPPRNTLVSPARPWVEVAGPEQAGLLHPEVRIAIAPDLAMFWYNPYQGIVRARVPSTISDLRALRMYNRVNGTRIDSLLAPAPRADETEPSETAPAKPAGHVDHVDPPAWARPAAPRPGTSSVSSTG